MSAHEDRADKQRAEVAKSISASLAEMRNNWPMHLELFAHRAKEVRAKYQALIREGFTEEQAIKLCVTM